MLIQRQRGMTTASMVLIAVFLLFVFITLFKLYPAYYDDFTVKGTVSNLAESPESAKLSPRELKTGILRRVRDVNRVDSVTEDHIEIKREGNKTTISIEYEVRTPLWGNLDGIATFSHHHEIDN